MPKDWVYEHRIGSLDLSVSELGDHLMVCVSGGDAPHIGSVVLAEPRPSLSGEGRSATSSVLNRLGHKDELVARSLAENLSAKLDTVVCCVCGIHKDAPTPEDLEACETLGTELANSVLEAIGTSDPIAPALHPSPSNDDTLESSHP